MVSMQQISPRPNGVALEGRRDEPRSEPRLALWVWLVEGDARCEASLREALAREGVSAEVRRVSNAQLGMPALVEPTRPARALLFEGFADASSARRALLAVRADSGLRELPALIALESSRDDWLDQACAFDDFLLCPWSPEELLGRIGAIERRRQPGHDEVLRIGPVSVDEGTRMAHVAGGRVQLTVRELALLSYLGLRCGRVLSREHLLAQVWGASYQGGRRTVDVHIRRLRVKLGAALHIETVRSGGYMLCPATG